MNSPFLDRPDWVMPCYDGRSIANIPATVAALLNAPGLPGLPPLERVLWKQYAPARRLVLLVLDVVGYDTFKCFFKQPAVESVQPITSVFPSSTVVALASLWTGRAPDQHGLVGTRMWWRDYGVLAQMIRLKVALKGYPEQLVDMGLKPETFLPEPNLSEHLAASGIPTHQFIPRAFKDSGRMARDFGSLASALSRAFEATSGQSCLQNRWLETSEVLTERYWV